MRGDPGLGHLELETAEYSTNIGNLNGEVGLCKTILAINLAIVAHVHTDGIRYGTVRQRAEDWCRAVCRVELIVTIIPVSKKLRLGRSTYSTAIVKPN